MAANDVTNKDALFDVLKKQLNDSELLELTMCIGIFIGVGRMNRFLDLEF
jgi:alkylhydroperoxidase family enzyme